ncbi:2Fe-2S iron-sulfur cluster binding domain-containing protein [Actinomadura sp. LD22]|uniref:2Fe-2S iron-sulfur cluster binding domain-containing protein n=1 Tax=Actinomadura physcomitrii TaxID=2650748 RepID=A0A6I4M6L3_9ACTN|nr:PDR/VanB family oxidoreductase [Actinomadura physcomitrii]MVZ99410.1 2Fe-2S iron-sulfur cluster binding domain-containing protein [Actinomadura physcomitrii]
MIPPDLRGRRERDPFWVAVNAAFNGIQRFRSLRAPAPPAVRPVDRTMRLTVQEVRREAEDVVSLRLGAPDGRVLPAWQPGGHLDVLLASGRRRQYSLCGDPADRRSYRIAVRRLPGGGGGSVEMHGLREGDRLAVRGPRNAFPFLAHDRYVFLAGGIGITPILPMVTAADRYGADWSLVYTGRSRASLPFLDELPARRVTVRTDDEHGVPSAADLLGDVPAGTAVYCCGPAPMIDAVRAAVRMDATLHYERFAPPPVTGGKPFEVELRRSGRTLPVPADRSALDVIRDVLPDVAYSCRQGFCGTCRTAVLSGDVDDRAPSDQGDDSMLVCVSRAASGRISLDL